MTLQTEHPSDTIAKHERIPDHSQFESKYVVLSLLTLSIKTKLLELVTNVHTKWSQGF